MFFRIFHFLLTLTILTCLTLLLSNNRKNISISILIRLLFIEIFIAFFFIKSQTGIYLLTKCSNIFNILSEFSDKGINFVFGNMQQKELSCFFIKALCPIIFIYALIGILQYIYIIPIIIHVIGNILSKINGMGKLESSNAISSLILGQSVNFIIYKEILDKISEERLYTMAVTAMSTVSMSVISIYMTLLSPKYVLLAIILNIFSTFFILLILNPYNIDKIEDIQISYFKKSKSFFEIIGEHILSGSKVVIVITAILIAFISLISTINALFIFIFGISFQEILGYFLCCFAWMIGIPKQEIIPVGCIMATKLVSNEFIAMIELQKVTQNLSSRSIGILSVFLVSFSNLSSIGIITGAIKVLNKKQGYTISRYGIKLVYSSTLVNLLSAAISGLVID